MKRVLRWTLNGAIITSAMACVATAAFWIRSLSRIEEVSYLRKNGTFFGLDTHRHGAGFSRVTDAAKLYGGLPRPLRPREGWSAASHRAGVSESFTDESYSDITADVDSTAVEVGADSKARGAKVRQAQASIVHGTIVYQWSPPRNFFFGFGWDNADYPADGGTCHSWRFVFPFWLPMAVFAASPLLRLRSVVRCRRALRRGAAGLCPTCGYDLRATPGRCPECGAMPGPMEAT